MTKDTTTTDTENNNVVSLGSFRSKDNAPTQPHVGVLGAPPDTPNTVQVTQEQLAAIKERNIIVKTHQGDVHISGFIGLSPNFLAVGDKVGAIKYACSNDYWLSVEDVTEGVHALPAKVNTIKGKSTVTKTPPKK